MSLLWDPCSCWLHLICKAGWMPGFTCNIPWPLSVVCPRESRSKEPCTGLILVWTYFYAGTILLFGHREPWLCTPAPEKKHNTISVMFLLFVFFHTTRGLQNGNIDGFLSIRLTHAYMRLELLCLLYSATLAAPQEAQTLFLFFLLWQGSHADCKNINHYVPVKPNPLSAAGSQQPGVFWETWPISDKGYLITSQGCKETVGAKNCEIYITSFFWKSWTLQAPII